MITRLNEFKKINEEVSEPQKMVINEKPLIEAAKAIAFLCDGEYGITYWNKDKNHILVCLGDSSPFDNEGLEQYLKQIIRKGDWKTEELIKVEIADEYMPNSEEGGWFVFNDKDKFVEY